MSLKHAILGFLSVEGMNGYQLKRHFDESISRFWSVSISQIYPTLNDMLQSELITVHENSESSRVSKDYFITDKGREELKNWLMEPAQQEPIRSELLVKLYFSSSIDKDTVIQQLSEKKIEAQKRIEMYDSFMEHLQKNHGEKKDYSSDAVFWRMTVRYGVYQSNAFIEWCDECIEMLNGNDKRR